MLIEANNKCNKKHHDAMIQYFWEIQFRRKMWLQFCVCLQDKHIYYSEMANALQKMEEICSYIRAILEGAVNLWLCECSTRRNYSDFENLYVIQEEVNEELFQLNPAPQASCLQDGRGPSDRNKSEYLCLNLVLLETVFVFLIMFIAHVHI